MHLAALTSLACVLKDVPSPACPFVFRSRRTAEAELQAEPVARQQPLPQQQSAPPAELLADFDPAALLGLLSSKSAAWLWKDRSRSSSFSSSSAHSSSGSASTSGSALVGTDAAALVERAGCRQTPEWWDAQSGRQISACMVRWAHCCSGLGWLGSWGCDVACIEACMHAPTCVFSLLPNAGRRTQAVVGQSAQQDRRHFGGAACGGCA